MLRQLDGAVLVGQLLASLTGNGPFQGFANSGDTTRTKSWGLETKRRPEKGGNVDELRCIAARRGLGRVCGPKTTTGTAESDQSGLIGRVRGKTPKGVAGDLCSVRDLKTNLSATYRHYRQWSPCSSTKRPGSWALWSQVEDLWQSRHRRRSLRVVRVTSHNSEPTAAEPTRDGSPSLSPRLVSRFLG